jgi:hypothetical protein
METLSKSTGGQDLSHPASKPLDQPRSRRRWPWFIVGAVLLVAKSEGIAEASHHRSTLIVILALALVGAVLRPRPAVIAVTVAPLLALVLDPHPLLAGLAVGVGVFILLMVIFVGIATVMHARQARSWKPGRVRRS